MSEPFPIDSAMASDHQRPGQRILPIGNTKPSVVDILGAFVCAQAVYSLNVELAVKDILARLPTFPIHFEKVHVSLGRSGGESKFLVAYTSDAVFIAFRGLSEFDDETESYEMMEERCAFLLYESESALSEFGNAMLGSEQRMIVSYLLQSGKRIVFCGQQIGGVVTHLVMLSILNDTTIFETGSAIFSIAFGAPKIFDLADAERVNLDDSLKNHFLSFVHASDPMSISLSPSDHDRTDRSNLTSIGRIVALNSLMQELNLDGNDGYYLSSLVEWIGTEFGNDSTGQSSSSIQTPAVSTPAPVVSSAQWKTTDTGTRYIEIYGQHLLFLRCSVELNGVEPFQTKVLTVNSLLIMDGRDDELHRSGSHENGSMDCVIIRTAFGSANCAVTQEYTNCAGVRKLLPQVVQTLIALSRPPMPIRPSDQVLARLDRIVQSAPGLEDKRLSTELEKIVGREYLVENIHDVNKLVERVTSFLNNRCEVQYNRVLVKSMKLLILAALGVSIAAAAAYGVPILAGSYVVEDFLWWAVWSKFGQVLFEKYTVSFNYAGFLTLAISEVDTISSQPRDPQIQSSPESLDADFLRERELLEKVRKDRLYSMLLLEDQSGHWKRLNFKSKCLEGITEDSKKKLLQKMLIVVNTMELFESEVKGKRFVGIQGAEDVGKSTFIKKALERCGQTADLPVASYRQHTQVVKPYIVNESTWLVDFPGSNGSSTFAHEWKKFTALPSSCVLLLVFKDDIKEDQCQMYKKMKKELQMQITVVFNKVDQKFTPQKKDYYTNEKFANLRDLAAKQLGCEHEDVHFAALQPKRGTDVSMLKERGVLDFDDLAHKLCLP